MYVLYFICHGIIHSSSNRTWKKRFTQLGPNVNTTGSYKYSLISMGLLGIITITHKGLQGRTLILYPTGNTCYEWSDASPGTYIITAGKITDRNINCSWKDHLKYLTNIYGSFSLLDFFYLIL